jgi:uncharacterized Fe-S cluster protein YjdI
MPLKLPGRERAKTVPHIPVEAPVLLIREYGSRTLLAQTRCNGKTAWASTHDDDVVEGSSVWARDANVVCHFFCIRGNQTIFNGTNDSGLHGEQRFVQADNQKTRRVGPNGNMAYRENLYGLASGLCSRVAFRPPSTAYNFSDMGNTVPVESALPLLSLHHAQYEARLLSNREPPFLPS